MKVVKRHEAEKAVKSILECIPEDFAVWLWNERSDRKIFFTDALDKEDLAKVGGGADDIGKAFNQEAKYFLVKNGKYISLSCGIDESPLSPFRADELAEIIVSEDNGQCYFDDSYNENTLSYLNENYGGDPIRMVLDRLLDEEDV